MKYGTIYGKKNTLKPTMVLVARRKRWKSLSANTIKLKDGGTMIMFFDLWKITALKELMEKYKFKQVNDYLSVNRILNL
jgi:site-specific DNA-methyltransferase (adenine-specific)